MLSLDVCWLFRAARSASKGEKFVARIAADKRLLLIHLIMAFEPALLD
jgi:hypothetical protein